MRKHAFAITSLDVVRCPKASLSPRHYNPGGSCNCPEGRPVQMFQLWGHVVLYSYPEHGCWYGLTDGDPEHLYWAPMWRDGSMAPGGTGRGGVGGGGTAPPAAGDGA